jgi:bifunctional ADP-heptose synthase (sugar kinase/adenylyltransferase)
MRILLVGDIIRDFYRICRLKGNLCQEMPLPQLEEVRSYTSMGGAGLVRLNLLSLLSERVDLFSRGISTKERIAIEPFNHWLCRIDADQTQLERDMSWETQLYGALHSSDYDLVVVSDYSKGTLTFNLARMIVGECVTGRYQKPLFVDARHHWDWYMGAYAAFPNELEFRPGMADLFKHVIRKSGPNGCFVDGFHVPLEHGDRDSPAVDICGAGDVFLAGFVTMFASQLGRDQDPEGESAMLKLCAIFANRCAHISVQHFGTHVVTPNDL